MAQNTSTAVMQRRREAKDSLDDFPTPPWATRALCEWIARHSPVRLGDLSVREPAANRGHMVRPLFEYFGHVMASDVHDYGAGYRVEDYLARATKVEDRLVEDAEDALDGMIARQRLASLKAGTEKIVSGAELEARLASLMDD